MHIRCFFKVLVQMMPHTYIQMYHVQYMFNTSQLHELQLLAMVNLFIDLLCMYIVPNNKICTINYMMPSS